MSSLYARLLGTVSAVLASSVLLPLTVAASVLDPPIPDVWKLAATTVGKPVKQIYLGKNAFLRYANPAKLDAGSATFDVWGKFVYTEPQTRGGKIFTTDIIHFELDCDASTTRLLREVLLDADGKLVRDYKQAGLLQKFDPGYTGDLDELPMAAEIALTDQDFTCDADTD